MAFFQDSRNPFSPYFGWRYGDNPYYETGSQPSPFRPQQGQQGFAPWQQFGGQGGGGAGPQAGGSWPQTPSFPQFPPLGNFQFPSLNPPSPGFDFQPPQLNLPQPGFDFTPPTLTPPAQGRQYPDVTGAGSPLQNYQPGWGGDAAWRQTTSPGGPPISSLLPQGGLNPPAPLRPLNLPDSPSLQNLLAGIAGGGVSVLPYGGFPSSGGRDFAIDLPPVAQAPTAQAGNSPGRQQTAQISTGINMPSLQPQPLTMPMPAAPTGNQSFGAAMTPNYQEALLPQLMALAGQNYQAQAGLENEAQASRNQAAMNWGDLAQTLKRVMQEAGLRRLQNISQGLAGLPWGEGRYS